MRGLQTECWAHSPSDMAVSNLRRKVSEAPGPAAVALPPAAAASFPYTRSIRTRPDLMPVPPIILLHMFIQSPLGHTKFLLLPPGKNQKKFKKITYNQIR